MEGQRQVSERNARYVRNHLKPVAKSIYNNTKTFRFNGSLHKSIHSSGLNLMTNNTKVAATEGVQGQMTKTFQFQILNNSFYNQNASTQDTTMQKASTQSVINQAKSVLNSTRQNMYSSPRVVRPVKIETVSPFTVFN